MPLAEKRVVKTKASKVNPTYVLVYGRLKRILVPYSERLTVTTDESGHYCLSVDYSEKFKKGFPVAWVILGKGYVSYHFMPVYMFPKLRNGLSKALLARMQGKSCFNFKNLDEELFKELESMTADGFAMARRFMADPSLSAAAPQP